MIVLVLLSSLARRTRGGIGATATGPHSPLVMNRRGSSLSPRRRAVGSSGVRVGWSVPDRGSGCGCRTSGLATSSSCGRGNACARSASLLPSEPEFSPVQRRDPRQTHPGVLSRHSRWPAPDACHHARPLTPTGRAAPHPPIAGRNDGSPLPEPSLRFLASPLRSIGVVVGG